MSRCKYCRWKWESMELPHESKENRAMMLYDVIMRSIDHKEWERANIDVMFHKWRIEFMNIIN